MEENNKKPKKEENELLKPVIYLMVIIGVMWVLSLIIK